MQTEIWDMDSGEIKLIDATLREGSYTAGTGAFIVQANYCTNNWSQEPGCLCNF